MRRSSRIVRGIVLDESMDLSLYELCTVCGVSAERVIDMVDEGVVEPRGANIREWRFAGSAVRRVQIALRLQQDLGVNLAGAALVLELLEELETLRRMQGRGGRFG